MEGNSKQQDPAEKIRQMFLDSDDSSSDMDHDDDILGNLGNDTSINKGMKQVHQM